MAYAISRVLQPSKACGLSKPATAKMLFIEAAILEHNNTMAF
jgi:hypothetical protein